MKIQKQEAEFIFQDVCPLKNKPILIRLIVYYNENKFTIKPNILEEYFSFINIKEESLVPTIVANLIIKAIEFAKKELEQNKIKNND